MRVCLRHWCGHPADERLSPAPGTAHRRRARIGFARIHAVAHRPSDRQPRLLAQPCVALARDPGYRTAVLCGRLCGVRPARGDDTAVACSALMASARLVGPDLL